MIDNDVIIIIIIIINDIYIAQIRKFSKCVACVSVREVMDAVSGLKTAKSVGPNGLASESFTFSGVKLLVDLSLL